MPISGIQYPLLANEQDFEKLCLKIFRHIWNDPNAHRVAGRGYEQYGCDIVGNPSPDVFHAVQCKNTTDLAKSKPTVKTLREEVGKALRFEPKLTSWTFAVAGGKDPVIEREANKLSAEHSRNGLFSVHYWSWEQIESHFNDEIVEEFYPQLLREKPALRVDTEAKAELSEILQIVRSIKSDQSATSVGGLTHTADASNAADEVADQKLHALIDFARDEITSAPKTAFGQIERLISQYYATGTSRVKYRLLANKAAALLEMGHDEEAAHLYIEAFQHDPESPGAILNASLGHLLLKHNTEATRLTKIAVEKDPKSGDAVALRISAAINEPEISDPAILLPNDWDPPSNVLVALSRWHRDRGNLNKQIHYLKSAYAIDPASRHVRAEYAAALLLLHADENVIRFSINTSAEQRRDIEESVAILREVWNEVKNTELAPSYYIPANNLAAGLRYLGDYRGAIQILEEVILIAPDQPELRRHICVAYVHSGQIDKTEPYLQYLSSSSSDRALRADILVLLNRHAEALAEFEKIGDDAEQETLLQVSVEKVRLIRKLKGLAEAKYLAESIVADHPDHPAGYLALALLSAEEPNSKAAIKAARKGLKKSKDGYEVWRAQLGECLYSVEDWDGAADALAPLLLNSDDFPPFRRYLTALYRADRRRELADRLGSLPASVAEMPFYLRISAAAYLRVGNSRKAKEYLERYTAVEPYDLEARINLFQLHIDFGETAAADAFLDGPHEYPEASTHELCQLFTLLDYYDRGRHSLELAYQTLRDHWDDPEVHRAVMGLMFVGKSAFKAIPPTDTVQLDTSVTVRDMNGVESSFTIVEKQGASRGLNEIHESEPLAQRLLGLKIGDTFSRGSDVLAESFEIVEISDKFTQLFRKSQTEYFVRFPEDKAIYRFDFDEANPEATIQKMIDTSRLRREHVSKMLDLYGKHQCTISILSRLTGNNSIDTWYGLMEVNQNFFVATGTLSERNAAFKVLAEEKPLLMDALTFWICGSLGLLEVIERHYGAIRLTNSSLLQLKSAYKEREDAASRAGGSITELDGKLLISKIPPDRRNASIELARKIYDFARDHAQIVDAIPAKDKDRKTREAFGMMETSFLDTAAAASRNDLLLVSEDKLFRDLVKSAHEVSGVWLQAVIMFAKEMRGLSNETYIEASRMLQIMGHDFTAVDPDILLAAAEKENYFATDMFNRVIRSISAKNSDLRSSLRVACRFLAALWAKNIHISQKKELTESILTSYREHHKAQLPQIVELFRIAGKPRRGNHNSYEDFRRISEHFRKSIRDWLRANPDILKYSFPDAQSVINAVWS